jgi:hypothetical protein
VEEPTPSDRIRSALLQLLEERGPEKTACPSAVARKVADEVRDSDKSADDEEEAWRELMPQVRAAARELAEEGRIEVTQGGQQVDIDEASGPVRLGLPSGRSD